MSQALHLGPVVLPWSLLLLLVAVLAALFLGKRLGKASGHDVEAALWQSLLAGLVVARLAFVWQFRSAYAEAPLDALDIRDGGWNATAGLVGTWLFALARQVKHPALERPLRFALLLGTGTWVAGVMVLSVQPGAGQTLPPLRLVTLDGTAAEVSGFVGKPTVINLWATWCPPCVREMPTLLQAQRDHPSVNFVFINQGEPAEKVRAWLSARKLPLRHVLLDSKGQAGTAFGQRALPTTLFFDAHGRLVETRIGELSRATLTQKLEAVAR